MTADRLTAARPFDRTDALDGVYRQYAPRVARWARHLLGPALDAEDVVHDVFLIVHAKLPGHPEDEDLAPWLYRITANVVRDRRRRERRYRLRNWTASELPREATLTPVDELERRQANTLVYHLLEEMKEKYRAVIILFEIEQLSGEEIATLLDVKLKTVWVWRHRARAQFRLLLERHQRREGRHVFE